MEVAAWLNMGDVLERVKSNYARATAKTGHCTSGDYLIAGSLVSLRFASTALCDRLTPAFAHLVAPSNNTFEEPSLTVHLWDSASTGIEPPVRAPIPAADAIGTLHHFDEPPLRGAFQPGLQTLSIMDSQANAAWHWVGSAFEQSAWEQACPIRQILFWWLSTRGYLQVHGAAVGTSERGVLLVGPPGSGKSTVALACLGSELLYAGDDYVATTIDPPLRLASLYNSGKVKAEHAQECLPFLRPLLGHANLLDSEKAVIYVHEDFPDRTTAGFQLEALIVPKFDPQRRESRLVELSRAAAFAALGPTTIFQLHTAGKDELSSMSSLATRLPCYALEFGPDLLTVPGQITALLSTKRALEDV